MTDRGSIPPPGSGPQGGPQQPYPPQQPSQPQQSDAPLPDVAALLASSSTTKTVPRSTRYLAFFGGLGAIVLLAILIPGSGSKQITVAPVAVQRVNEDVTVKTSDGKTYSIDAASGEAPLVASETYKCDLDGNELSNCKPAPLATAPQATPAASSAPTVTVKVTGKLGQGTVNGQASPMYIGTDSASYEVADAQTFNALQSGQTYVCKNAGPATQNGTKAFGFAASAKITGCTPR